MGVTEGMRDDHDVGGIWLSARQPTRSTKPSILQMANFNSTKNPFTVSFQTFALTEGYCT